MKKNGVRILLIEDSPGDALLLQEFLHDCRFPCFFETAGRVHLALDLLRERSFDLVIMDLSLPDSRGYEAVRLVKSACPGLPLILHSGSFSGQAEDMLKQAGARALFRKGRFEIQDLCSAIEAAVEETEDEDR